MPQASDELQDLMKKWFDSIMDDQPRAFLLSHGFTEARGFIRPPVPSHSLSHEEYCCLLFLHDEWDYAYARR